MGFRMVSNLRWFGGNREWCHAVVRTCVWSRGGTGSRLSNYSRTDEPDATELAGPCGPREARMPEGRRVIRSLSCSCSYIQLESLSCHRSTVATPVRWIMLGTCHKPCLTRYPRTRAILSGIGALRVPTLQASMSAEKTSVD